MVDGRALLVRPFDPGDIHLIERAIGESGLGLTTQAAKTVIRVPVPQLSQDRREELAAAAGRLAEEARVAVRNVRRDALRDAAAIKAVDDRRRHEESVGDLVRRYLGLVDEELRREDPQRPWRGGSLAANGAEGQEKAEGEARRPRRHDSRRGVLDFLGRARGEALCLRPVDPLEPGLSDRHLA